MVLYHRTTKANAEQIVARKAFEDRSGRVGNSGILSGVWLTSAPVAPYDGLHGTVLLKVTIHKTESELSKYERTEQGNLYREFVIPAMWFKHASTIEIADDP